MNEVLLALGRSGSDPDAVLHSVVASARRLCNADVGQVYLIEGGTFVLKSWVGLSREFTAYIEQHPFGLDRRTLLGRVAEDRVIQQIPDVLADPAYGRQDVQRIGNYRTLLAAPMLLDDEVVGVLSLWRYEAQSFDEQDIAPLQAFAAQAAIVVRHVHLVKALESRGAELARKVEQLEALREVGASVSSSLDLDQVLAAIIMNAVRFSGCDGGSMLEFAEEERRFFVRTAYETSPELLARLRAVEIGIDTTLVGRAAREGRPLVVPDLATVELDEHLRLLRDDGWRSMVTVPVLSGEGIVGALVVRRRAAGDFSRETLEFLEAFAGQSALAILNARLFRELETKTAELQVVSQHKSEFLASMSHELRTPLNAVIGFSEVLLERMFGELNERQDEYVRDILSSGRHLLQLLNDILDLSKVEAGRMEVDASTFPLRPALEYALSMVRARAAAHGISLSLEAGDAPETLHADELRFRQVLVNLLSNAVKFAPDGGRVVLAAARADDELSVTVTDTGVGIPPADRELIFESFQQGRRGPQREEGTGLGLALCRRIVALLGGRMWLETEVGVGSTFGFSVPLRPQASQAPAAVDAEAPSIVVIDDDRASLDLITAYLDGLGLQVVLSRDGLEGLGMIRALHPAAVLLDIRLPGIDGWEVLSRLQSDVMTRDIPVIVVSMLDERTRGLTLGASDYLVKPVARDAIVGALQRNGLVPSAAWGG
ncbi:GAF domain-containing protein [Microbacterium sp. BK668]|uniref:hybrid sensor histidine kinase/response regulator n=1 Tax=Microbacterium sp. BK668 TaxID=2512118 RepID=UPI001060046A|nr:GAF domain-containing protein [Microbacterium sp. BK668]